MRFDTSERKVSHLAYFVFSKDRATTVRRKQDYN